MRVQWYYSNGCSWIPLEKHTQNILESLWAINSSTFIQSDDFKDVVYVNMTNMCIVHKNSSYTIARTA
ncbi:hypothetical protein K501DRAFT_243463 [Backusella circina FSU 941]|nr:hypothetical protein K501DRAFT_243463 [Backusella circina FSU 941]